MFAIIFAIGEKANKKNYHKKLIFVMYTIILLEYGYFSIPMMYVSFTLLIVLTLAGINLAYSNENNYLENELNMCEYLVYHMFKFFYLIKFYIFIVCVLVLFVISQLDFLLNINIYHTVVILFFLIYHLVSNSSDEFNIVAFYTSRDSITVSKKEKIELFEKLLTGEENKWDSIIYMMFSEDRYFFERKGFNRSLIDMIRNKYENGKFDRESDDFKKDRNFTRILKRILYIISHPVKSIRKVGLSIFNLLKILSRGYSTLPSQFIRIKSMVPNSYKYTIRRKLFVEWIYTKYFLKAWQKYIIRTNFFYDVPAENKKNSSIEYLKVLLLLSYYMEILKSPPNIDTLIERFQSRVSQSYYKKQYEYLKTTQEYQHYKDQNKKIIRQYLKLYINRVR